jgi:putative transposase
MFTRRDVIPADPLMPQLRERGGKWYLPEPPTMAELYRTLPASTPDAKWRVWTLSRVEIPLREFRRRPEVGYPRWHHYHDHLSLGAGVQSGSPVRLTHLPAEYRGQAVVRLSGIGDVRLIVHRPLPPSAVIKCAVVTRDHDRRIWHASLQCELSAADEDGYACRSTDAPIGIDVGVAIPIATSDPAHVVGQPAALRRARRKVIERQRRLSRCMRGSKRRRRAKERLARAHAAVARIRKGWLHMQSAVLSRQYRMIAAEELALANMTRSAAGTAAEPGTRVAAKAGLNREMLSIAAGALRSALEWKAVRAGGVMVAVDPRYTSRGCPECGDAVIPDRHRVMHCAGCGLIIDRDAGAARNILARARATLVSGSDAGIMPGGHSADGEGDALALPDDPQTLRPALPAMYDGASSRSTLSSRTRQLPGGIERLSDAEIAGIARMRQAQQDQALAAGERRQKRIAAQTAGRRRKALEKRGASDCGARDIRPAAAMPGAPR